VIRPLEQLVAGGATLQYHGDFDAGGLSIARTLGRRVAWQAWRFDSASCTEAAMPGLPSLRGILGEMVWDPSLAVTMADVGLKVEEEQVLGSLLADLAPTE
jgi:hypothetical protein